MSTRIIVSTVASLFVASIALSQMKYGRSRSASPTPAPTPTPTPLQRTAPAQIQPLIPAQRASPPPRTTPTPTKPALVPRVTPTPPQPKPTPVRKTALMQTQSPTPTPKTTAVQTLQATAPQQRAMSVPRATPAPLQQKALPTSAPTVAKPTPTPVPPPDVKAYLDRQVANSKDKKFHLTGNGRDIALTPFHVWAQKSTGADSTSTCIDMKSDDGRIYDIDFVTTGAQVTGVKVHKINGEALR